MKALAIRKKSTGEYFTGSGCFESEGLPRVFKRRNHATCALTRWLKYRRYYNKDIDPADFEVVLLEVSWA